MKNMQAMYTYDFEIGVRVWGLKFDSGSFFCVFLTSNKALCIRRTYARYAHQNQQTYEELSLHAKPSISGESVNK